MRVGNNWRPTAGISIARRGLVKSRRDRSARIAEPGEISRNYVFAIDLRADDVEARSGRVNRWRQ